MSNDIRTLADVQPGGRVRLGDQAERARFEAWAESEGYHVERQQRGNVGDYTRDEVRELWGMWLLNPQQLLDAAKKKATSYGRASVQDGASCAGASQAGHGGHVRDARKALDKALAVMSAKAALSAQPSPGGQEYAWNIAELVRVDLDRQSCPDAYMRIAMESVVKHLAARQPVGEPVGYLFTDDPAVYAMPGSGFHSGAEPPKNAINVVPLYTAPPAQAVDLEELRRAVCVVNVVGQIDGHDVVRRNSVLDVIDYRRQRLVDSQAVGK